MTQRAALYSQTDISRALRAARKEGLTIKLQPDGSIIIVEPDLSPQSTQDTRPERVVVEKDFHL